MTAARVPTRSAQTPLVQAAGTSELVRRWQGDRDSAARQELCQRFMPLARKLAARYRNPNDAYEDLVQVASVGLLGAIERFDPDRETSFASFAVPTILGELKRYFRNTGWSVHVPRRAQEMALRVDRASREISASTGRAPRVQHLAEYLELLGGGRPRRTGRASPTTRTPWTHPRRGPTSRRRGRWSRRSAPKTPTSAWLRPSCR